MRDDNLVFMDNRYYCIDCEELFEIGGGHKNISLFFNKWILLSLVTYLCKLNYLTHWSVLITMCPNKKVSASEASWSGSYFQDWDSKSETLCTGHCYTMGMSASCGRTHRNRVVPLKGNKILSGKGHIVIMVGRTLNRIGLFHPLRHVFLGDSEGMAVVCRNGTISPVFNTVCLRPIWIWIWIWFARTVIRTWTTYQGNYGKSYQ